MLPGSRPSTFFERMVARRTAKLAAKVASPSGTGRNSRVCARRLSASKSCPAARNSSTAKSRWIQPSSCGCTSAGLARTMSNIVLVLEFFTVAQP